MEPDSGSLALVDGIPGVVWEAYGQPDAAQQRIDFISPSVETMLGTSVQEWLGTPNFWLSIVHPEDRDRAAAVAASAFARGEAHSHNDCHPRPPPRSRGDRPAGRLPDDRLRVTMRVNIGG